MAEGIGDAIQYFNEDFGRVSPEDYINRYKHKIKKITGLEVSDTLKIESSTKGFLREQAHSSHDAINSEKELHENEGFEFILRSHGFLGEDEQYKSSYFFHSYDEIAGYYDIEQQKMVLLETRDDESMQALLLHEMMHAAQDNYLRLNSIYSNNELSLDEYFAKTALIEGQAEAVGYLENLSKLQYEYDPLEILDKFDDWLLGLTSNTEDSSEVFKSFPYAYGLFFVLEQYFMHENKDFKVMLENLPTTTEQVLHRDKYVECEPRKETNLEAIDFSSSNLFAEVDVLLATTLGEFYILQMFSNTLSESSVSSRSIASGWGGDHMVVLRNGEQKFSVWETVWDTSNDALLFYEEYKKIGNQADNDDFVEKNIFLHEKNNRVLVFAGDVPGDFYKKMIRDEK